MQTGAVLRDIQKEDSLTQINIDKVALRFRNSGSSMRANRPGGRVIQGNAIKVFIDIFGSTRTPVNIEGLDNTWSDQDDMKTI